MYTRKGVSHLLDRVEFSINLSLGLKQTVLAVVQCPYKGEKKLLKMWLLFVQTFGNI